MTARRYFRAIVPLFVALALVLTLSPPSSARLQDGATFNTPAPWGGLAERERIVRTIERAINNTPARTNGRQSKILIATFLLDRRRSVSTLIRACKRGVAVRVLLDQDIVSSASRRLIKALNSDNVSDRNRDGKRDRPAKRGPCDTKKKKDKKGKGDGRKGDGRKGDGRKGKQDGKRGKSGGRSDLGEDGPEIGMTKAEAMRSMKRPMRKPLTWGADRSYVKKCERSCRGRGGNMHSKMYLFSRVNKVKDVVMVSSSNLNHGGANMGWNDLWTMTERPKSFRAYSRIHRQMTRDKLVKRGLVTVNEGPYQSRFFPMVNAGKRKDPTLKDLSKIGCRGPLGRTKIRVSMFYWKGSRGNYLATKLLDLARRGCDVGIIYGAPSIQMASRLREAARRGLVKVYDSRWDRNQDGYSESRTHAKYVAIRGRYGKDKKARRVLTGSQNWVAGSLSLSDETTLSIRGKRAYAAYISNWNVIRTKSRRVPYQW